ncbi:phosphoribosylaminoimidazolesuccinocarboxamide synthase [Alicyclobacillaceae bacterium I2511]|nr:phosphoribosylaminoimidazolesuccinocarboxamide synthase [Alicyclobacillaceae bacterium I2511]
MTETTGAGVQGADKGQMVYEGKAKRVYEGPQPDTYVVVYKDDATAFNGEKRGTIVGKGVINNRISNILFRYLETKGIPTHYLKDLSERETLVRALTIVPVEVVVRNRVAGSMAKRLGLPEGQVLPYPVVEFYYKNDALGDPLVNEGHVTALGWASRAEVAAIQTLALRIGELLGQFFTPRGVALVDFKLEFGRDSAGGIRLADEISPDTCRFWDATSGEKLDKDRFRRDLGGVEEAYAEMLRRVEVQA